MEHQGAGRHILHRAVPMFSENCFRIAKRKPKKENHQIHESLNKKLRDIVV